MNLVLVDRGVRHAPPGADEGLLWNVVPSVLPDGGAHLLRRGAVLVETRPGLQLCGAASAVEEANLGQACLTPEEDNAGAALFDVVLEGPEELSAGGIGLAEPEGGSGLAVKLPMPQRHTGSIPGTASPFGARLRSRSERGNQNVPEQPRSMATGPSILPGDRRWAGCAARRQCADSAWNSSRKPCLSSMQFQRGAFRRTNTFS